MVWNFYHKDTSFRVWQPWIELVDDVPINPSSSVQIHIEFRQLLKFQWKVRSDDETRERVVSEKEITTAEQAIRVEPDMFLHYNASHYVISDVLSSFNTPTSQRDKIIDEVICEGREIGNHVSDIGLKILPLSVEIVIDVVYWCTETDWLIRELLAAEDERAGSDGMVPASTSSVVALESVRMVKGGDGDGESCPVCLEDIPVGVQIIRLPCLHLFHDHCIIRWLEKSHYCPICRFEMPT